VYCLYVLNREIFVRCHHLLLGGHKVSCGFTNVFSIILVCTIHSGVVIGFTMFEATVSEDGGSTEAVITAIGSSVSGIVTVGVSTVDQSAIGKYLGGSSIPCSILNCHHY